eukprot:gene11493-15396_t
MSFDNLTAQIKNFQKSTVNLSQDTKEYAYESPLERARREVQRQLVESEKYRAEILKNVTTFAGLTPQALISAAQNMDEVYFNEGDIIIQQDEIGDSFYVLEYGLVSVTRKANINDYGEVPKELARLGKNSHFGEVALLTSEPRSATITVISNTAKVLRMTKVKFDELLNTTTSLLAENRRIIGKDVLESVALFKSLNHINKKKLLDVMQPISFLANTYICRQGSIGSTFYILTEGTCRVTLNSDDRAEVEVGKLRPGDFFGEIALIEPSNKRTANVISNESVSCLTLSRNDFNRLLKNLKVKLLENQVGKNAPLTQKVESKNSQVLSKKRRISGYDTHGRRDDNRVTTLLKRFGRFCAETLWSSLYARMYREMLLDNSKCLEYGPYAASIMGSFDPDLRSKSIEDIQAQVVKCLDMDITRRSSSDHSFIYGLLKQRNAFRDRLCRNWPPHQFFALCKRVRICRIKAFRNIYEADSRGSCAYLILRGSVRIFTKLSDNNDKSKMIFEEDLVPGEVFGEGALGGINTRLSTAQAITNVDLAIIDVSDFNMAHDKDTLQMGVDERSKFLLSIPLFRDWDSYKILRLAHALVQEEINKNVVLTKPGQVCKDFYLIVNGHVNVMNNLEKKYNLSTLLPYDYFGESGIINKFTKASKARVYEHYPSISMSKLDVLILHENNFNLLDLTAIDILRKTFQSKLSYRENRIKDSKYERAKVRKQYRSMKREESLLPHYYQDLATKQTITLTNGANNNIPSELPLLNQNNNMIAQGSPQALFTTRSSHKDSTQVTTNTSHHNHHHNDNNKDFQHLSNSNLADTTYDVITGNIKVKFQHNDSQNHHTSHTATSAVTMTSDVAAKPYTTSSAMGRSSLLMTDSIISITNNDNINLMRPGSAPNLMINSIYNSIDFDKNNNSNNNMMNISPHRTRPKTPTNQFSNDKNKLSDLEDIPHIFTQDFSPLMIVEKSKSPKHLSRIHEAIKHGNRPKTARLLMHSADAMKDVGFSGIHPTDRPKTPSHGYATPTNANHHTSSKSLSNSDISNSNNNSNNNDQNHDLNEHSSSLSTDPSATSRLRRLSLNEYNLNDDNDRKNQESNRPSSPINILNLDNFDNKRFRGSLRIPSQTSYASSPHNNHFVSSK